MAKTRYIDTRFWHDTFIREHLNPLDRYLFLYFITNDKTNISGIYELPMSIISNETGIENEMLVKMLRRLDGKIHYIDGWIYVINFQKYQNTENPKIKKGIEIELAKIPSKIMEKIEEINKLYKITIPYVYPIDSLSHSNSNSNSNSNNITPLGIKVLKVKKNKYTYSQDFESFWEIYPKRVGKPKAYELWEKLTSDDQKKIMDDIPKRKQDDKWVNGFIKDPERYIKHRQWEDDIIKPRGKVEPQRKVDSFKK